MLNRDAGKAIVGVMLVSMFSGWLILRLDAAVKAGGTETTAYAVMKAFCIWGVSSFLVLFWRLGLDRWNRGKRK